MRILILLLALFATPVAACGIDSDCEVTGGTYRIYVPDGGADGAIFFAHGYGGSAAGTMGNDRLRALADRLGVVLVALASAGEDWTLPNAPEHGNGPPRDEIAYVAAVKADVVAQFGLDPDRMLLAGFSAGGMLTWNLICQRGDLFAAFVPMSGTFWKEPPQSCDTDAAVTHYHGTADTVVPIGGRAIGSSRQGDMGEVLAFYIRDRALTPAGPVDAPDGLSCQRWDGKEGTYLEYCTHPGGHRFSADWIERVWTRDMK